MNGKNSVAACIDKYNALSVADQMVLQALSALYEPASAGVVSSCLGAAGCRESHLRAFSPQIVSTRLSRLAKAGFAFERTTEPRGRKVHLWRCRPEVAEIAIRHAVRDGRFLPMAKAALTETRGRDWKGEGADDSPARRFRLAFHAGDWRLAGSELSTLSAGNPGEGGLLLATLAQLQPDDSWRRAARPAVFGPVLAAALRDALAGLIDPATLEELAWDALERDRENPGRGELILALADTLTLRGKMREAAKLPPLADADTAEAAQLPIAVAEGREDAPDLAERILARRRARLGAREALPNDSAAVWQALAVMIGDIPDAVETMLRRLAGPTLREHPHGGALDCLRHAFLFMAGQSAAARGIPSVPPDRHPFTVLCHALALLRIDPERAASLAGALEKSAREALAGTYRWLAAQFQAVSAAAAGGAADDAGRWPPLIRSFLDDEAWRRGLRALEELATAGDDGGEGAERRKRLAWLVNFPSRPETPFVPFEVQPVEQSMGRDGAWSKGRNIALKRIFQRSADLSYVTDQDRMAFSALRYDFNGLSQGFHFDPGAALTHLVGHPLVFRGDAGGAKLDVVAGQFELSASGADGGCEIVMEPALADFLPPEDGGEAPAERLGDDPPATAARLETPTRLRVYPLGERERRLARVVGDGLSIPARGRSEALRALGALSGKIRLHSDLPELAGEGESVEADARPRFHVMPQNPGLKVEVWSHPFGDDGPAYRPGRGGKVLTAEMDGRAVRAVRDAKLEKTLAAEAIAACPGLAGRDDGDLSWRLDDPEDALAFLAEAEELGERAVLTWPKGGRFRVRRLKGPGNLSIRVSGSSEWFELDGALRIDEGLVVDMARLLAELRHSSGRFVRIGEDEYVALTDELRRQLGDLEALGEFHDGKFRLPALAGPILEEFEAAGADLRADAEWRRQLSRRRELADFTPELPEEFHGELRNYQLEGFRWMARLSEWGTGACLADDMGLGKTVQALAMLIRRGGLGPALVVAPTSVCHNWIAETARFAPTLRIAPFGDGDRAARVAGLGPRDVLIVSYSLLRQEEKLLGGVKWATAVLDEAQAIKNVAAKRSKAAMSLDAGFRLITTGTPIENHLGELWNLFRFINPRLLGSWRKFQERFAVPIERNRDRDAGERLRRIIRPFILRRTKDQVLDSLPPKTEITLAVELDDRERAFYESLRRDAVERLEQDRSSPEKKRFQILAEIMRLRRACCSPELVRGGEGLSSAKQEQFRVMLEELVANSHKVLVFSQFVDHLSIIRRHLEKMGYVYQYLDGSTPERARKRAVNDFQAGVGDVFLISLKAGGLGLNLTAADYVIHMDPWWNPAVEDQASDRAHRIGQEKPVTVYRLVAAGTIEEKIVELHHAKRDLADNLLAGADQSASLDLDEILRLLREE